MSVIDRTEIAKSINEIVNSMKNEHHDFNSDDIDFKIIRNEIREKFVSTHGETKFNEIILRQEISRCLDCIYEPDIQKLTKENETLNSTINSQKTQIEELTKQIESLENTIESQKTQIEELKSENKLFKNEDSDLSYREQYEKFKMCFDNLFNTLIEENEQQEAMLDHYSDICPTYP